MESDAPRLEIPNVAAGMALSLCTMAALCLPTAFLRMRSRGVRALRENPADEDVTKSKRKDECDAPRATPPEGVPWG